MVKKNKIESLNSLHDMVQLDQNQIENLTSLHDMVMDQSNVKLVHCTIRMYNVKIKNHTVLYPLLSK